MTTIVLTHGAFHGSWCFEALVTELDARGVKTALVDLPLTDLTEDAAAVTAVLDGLDGPVILLGHSYGGAVVTVAGNHSSVERLVYLTALGPDAGELGSGGPMTIGEQFLTTMRVDDDGFPFIDPEFAAQVFYPDIDPEVLEIQEGMSLLKRRHGVQGQVPMSSVKTIRFFWSMVSARWPNVWVPMWSRCSAIIRRWWHVPQNSPTSSWHFSIKRLRSTGYNLRGERSFPLPSIGPL